MQPLYMFAITAIEVKSRANGGVNCGFLLAIHLLVCTRLFIAVFTKTIYNM